jgi:hypothetical protein
MARLLFAFLVYQKPRFGSYQAPLLFTRCPSIQGLLADLQQALMVGGV